jgi:hypothetical protein
VLKVRKGNNVLFGLTAKNLERLQENDPIRFNGEQIGMPNLVFYIAYGPDEIALVKEWAPERLAEVEAFYRKE